jgi:drug/metabolite transporter (DMT)-like permease
MHSTVSSIYRSHAAIIWMVMASFWFASMTILVASLTDGMHPFLIVLYRNLFALLMFIPGLIWFGPAHLKTASLSVHWSRALTGLVGMMLWFYALSITPANDAVALSFTMPIITALIAVVVLKEVVGWQHFAAMTVGFFGVLIVLRPDQSLFNKGGLIVLAATFTWAISNILVKKLTKSEAPRVIAFYLTLFMVPLSLPFAISVWAIPSYRELVLLILMAFAANLAQISLAHAYKRADISEVLPFDFARLIFVSAFAYVLFDQLIDVWTVVGAVVIFSSAVFIVRRQSIKRKELAAAAKATPDESAPLA